MEMVMVWQWEIVVPCRILGRSWRKGTASWKPRSNENIHRGESTRRRSQISGPLNRWRGHRYLERTKSEKITESAPVKVDGATPLVLRHLLMPDST